LRGCPRAAGPAGESTGRHGPIRRFAAERIPWCGKAAGRGGRSTPARSGRRPQPASRRSPAYVQARPYLLSPFSCGTPLRSPGRHPHDGEFTSAGASRCSCLRPFCHDEFAFVVKQNIGGLVITIYNGLAANQWFHYGDDPTLTSYHPLAQGCRHNDFPGEGAFALLQDIGDTESYHLKTPDATGWDRVAPPAYNDGLAFPVPLAADALGKPKNRNWGGTLKRRYAFSEPMKGAGATFYRISVIAADNTASRWAPVPTCRPPVVAALHRRRRCRAERSARSAWAAGQPVPHPLRRRRRLAERPVSWLSRYH